MLGTSLPPVRVIAILMARASALNAASALIRKCDVAEHWLGYVHVMVVLTVDEVNVEGDTGSERKGLQQVRDHLSGYYSMSTQ